MTFERNEKIDKRYTVAFSLRKEGAIELYRVRDREGALRFLKLYHIDMMDPEDMDPNGIPWEMVIRKKIHHPNVCEFVDSGSFKHHGYQLAYIVLQYVSAESLAKRLQRETKLNVEDARQVALVLLRLLRMLHKNGIVHHNINTNTVWLNLAGDITDLLLTGFSHAKVERGGEDDDLVAVGKILYRCLFGESPTMPPRLPNFTGKSVSDNLLAVLAKALAPEKKDRFANANDFVQALLGKVELAKKAVDGKETNVRRGNGFADVAGMAELKKKLNESVLYVLRDRERASRYRLNIPNGILLYGPPGCGKTFIAEKFAEEAGYHFLFVKSSDLASIYIHGTQEKIGALFHEARMNAPTVICFDEFDALVPKRMSVNNASHSGEVNEFLTQLNNCGKDNVFVIATTNQPDLIDEAILRPGRMDELVYVPMPDMEARAELFAIHLKGRPCEQGIDFYRLADLSKDYIASEIAMIVNNAAREASKEDADITQQMLERLVKGHNPVTTDARIKYYEELKLRMEDKHQDRPRIGF